ncbi:hypothetical protein DDE19_25975 [Micromonospora ureilytica]|uniref:Uncharacterized protein n=1 Tax=Micromonospora ureilytica TaxID=709868 RepID=A0A3N9XK85_9ACTN|nr:hypothetical protein [Micromonospora ureilytica]RQX13390.1 hypothetical protein DDE19_25975 [Micromonospora ureilytica]
MPLIYPKDREDAKTLARRLLAAAGTERHDEVLTTSDGPLGLAFDVPDDLAEQVLGAGGGRVVETPSEPAAELGEESTSADAGADVSEADAESDGRSSQPSARASRSSRTSRSGR